MTAKALEWRVNGGPWCGERRARLCPGDVATGGDRNSQVSVRYPAHAPTVPGIS